MAHGERGRGRLGRRPEGYTVIGDEMKAQLSLECHDGHTIDRLCVPVGQRLLAFGAVVWTTGSSASPP